eukprot:3744192-Alexandrium_andersonii.AAC.1
MHNDAAPLNVQENAAHAEPPVLAANRGTVAHMPSELTASPSFTIGALARRSLRQPPEQGASH